MSCVSLVLVYESDSAAGKPVPLARLSDRGIVAEVARAAVAQARERAAELSLFDELLGQMEHAEAQRLERLFGALKLRASMPRLPA